ncbi:MAG: hypothetical protein ACRCV9_13940 [Burkholderiaceae bacterium]
MKRDALPSPVSHDDEEVTNFSNNPTFESVLNTRLTRRRAMFGGAHATALSVIVAATGRRPNAHTHAYPHTYAEPNAHAYGAELYRRGQRACRYGCSA